MLTVSFAMTTVSEKETNPPREMLPGLLLYVKYGIT